MRIRRLLVPGLLAVCLAFRGHADLIASYTFSGSMSSTNAAVHITAADFSTTSTGGGLSAGPGTGSPSLGGNAFLQWGETGSSLNLTTGEYFQFSMTVEAGYEMDLADLSFYYGDAQSGSVACNLALFTSVAGFTNTADQVGATVAWSSGTTATPTFFATPATISLADPQFQNLTGTTTFRLYGWDAGSSGQIRVDDVALNGTVAAIPEPASASLVLLAGAGLLLARRRRA